MHNIQEIYSHVRHKLGRAKAEMQEYFSKTTSKSRLGEGDIVYVRIYERKNKLSPQVSRPCRVLAIRGNKAMIRALENHKIRDVHVEHLKQVSRKLAGHDTSHVISNDARDTQLPEVRPMLNNKGRPGHTQLSVLKQKLRSHTRSTKGTVCQHKAVYYPQLLEELGVDLHSFMHDMFDKLLTSLKAESLTHAVYTVLMIILGFNRYVEANSEVVVVFTSWLSILRRTRNI